MGYRLFLTGGDLMKMDHLHPLPHGEKYLEELIAVERRLGLCGLPPGWRHSRRMRVLYIWDVDVWYGGPMVHWFCRLYRFHCSLQNDRVDRSLVDILPPWNHVSHAGQFQRKELGIFTERSRVWIQISQQKHQTQWVIPFRGNQFTHQNREVNIAKSQKINCKHNKNMWKTEGEKSHTEREILPYQWQLQKCSLDSGELPLPIGRDPLFIQVMSNR